MTLTAFSNTFAGNPLDRASDRRSKADWVAERLASPEALAVAVWNGRPFVEDAKGGGLPEWNALGPRHHLVHVLPARREIEALIGLLLAPAPVSARGVALVRILLTNGCLLYTSPSPRD